MGDQLRFYYGNPEYTGSWEQAASVFAAHDSVNSERTSSLPLVQFWKPQGKGKGLNSWAKTLLEKCGEAPSDVEKFMFEYPVPVKKGKGKSSMTDLMIISKSRAIAIEAKWTECEKEYERISAWKKEGKDKTNREEVLKGWIQYINDYAESDILEARHLEMYDDIPYQLLHRIASACATAKQQGKREAVVIYQLFYDNRAKDNGRAVTQSAVEKFAEENLCSKFNKLFDDCKGKIPKLHIVKVNTTMDVTKEKNPEFAEILERAKTEKRDKKKSVLSDIFVLMQRSTANGVVYKFSKEGVEKFWPRELIVDEVRR